MSRLLLVLLLSLTILGPALPASAQAGDPNACDMPGELPNVIVGDLYEKWRYGSLNGITAFSIGTVSCNVGTCQLQWIEGSGANQHPTIGQNMFRLKEGRFEHVGQAWLKHGFYALSENYCSPDCIPTDGDYLGVNCSDPYTAGLNGRQTRLGPKFEVNPLTGFHPHPVTDMARTGDTIFKRLQVRDIDLDPALNPGALYFVEGQYIAQDDAAAGMQHDNASYRPITVFDRPQGGFDFDLAGETAQTKPAILAWADHDPGVEVLAVHDPQGGRFWVAGKATDLGAGQWAYEYAVQNLNSHRAARTFGVPIPVGMSMGNIGFHDVDYHSGEPFVGDDWMSNGGAGGLIEWQTSTWADNQNANALRWGTLYNFRFECDRPPARSLLTLGMFRPGEAGEPDAIVFEFLAPMACNSNGRCDPGENCFSCPGECADDGPDVDGDGVGYCGDCAENDNTIWSITSEVPLLYVARGPAGAAMLTWTEPLIAGALPLRFETLRSDIASDFSTAAVCLRAADDTERQLADLDAPNAGDLLFYLVRSRTTCPITEPGTTGGNSFGVERSATRCP